MKKYLNFFYVALFAVLTLSVTSCTDDDEPNGNSIVGTWQEDDAWVNVFGDKQFLRFTSDGVFFEVDIPDDMGENIEIAKGKYSINGNALKVYDFDPNYEYKIDIESRIVKLTDDKLVLSTLGFEQSYKRVADSTLDKYLK